MRIKQASAISAGEFDYHALAYYAGDMEKPLSVKIRQIRNSLGERQGDFAKRFGVQQASISRWEKGAMPDPPHLARLADLAGQTVQEFLGMDEKPSVGQQPGIPILAKVPAGSIREALADRRGSIPNFDPSIPPNAYALQVDGDSMDKVAQDGTTIVIDPDDVQLFPLQLYVVRSGDEVTFKQYVDSPPRLVPLSTNPDHHPINISTDREWSVEGKVIWVAARPRYAAFD